MNNAEKLKEYEDNIRTSMGAWFPEGRVVYRGKDLLYELADEPWMRLLLYGITGRMFNDKEIKLFEGIWVISSSYPDPRIWNNRVAAFAGAARSTGALGISAGIATSEATAYGLSPGIKCIDFLRQAKKNIDDGVHLDSFLKRYIKINRSLFGYGRPIARGDERILPLSKLAEKLGFAGGEYYKLAFEIEECLQKGRWRMKMNAFGVIAGLCADQGLSNREFYYYITTFYTAGMFPCMIDTFEKPEGTFLPLRCERIAYEGVEARHWV